MWFTPRASLTLLQFINFPNLFSCFYLLIQFRLTLDNCFLVPQLDKVDCQRTNKRTWLVKVTIAYLIWIIILMTMYDVILNNAFECISYALPFKVRCFPVFRFHYPEYTSLSPDATIRIPRTFSRNPFNSKCGITRITFLCYVNVM